MSAPDVEIYNLAILQIGVPTISSFSDESAAAQVGRRVYPAFRDGYLAGFYWYFAKDQANLNELLAEPVAQYEFSLKLPSDFLNLRRVLTPGVDYRLFGKNRLFAASRDIDIEYTKRAKEEDFPSEFTSALAWGVSASVALSLTEKPDVQANAAKMFAEMNRKARTMSLQQDPLDGFDTSGLIAVR